MGWNLYSRDRYGMKTTKLTKKIVLNTHKHTLTHFRWFFFRMNCNSQTRRVRSATICVLLLLAVYGQASSRAWARAKSIIDTFDSSCDSPLPLHSHGELVFRNHTLLLVFPSILISDACTISMEKWTIYTYKYIYLFIYTYIYYIYCIYTW